MPRPASIAALRRQIDRIDDQLLAAAQPARASGARGRPRRSSAASAAIYAPAREKGVLARLARQNGGPLGAGARARDLPRDHLGVARPRAAAARRVPRPAGDVHAPGGARSSSARRPTTCRRRPIAEVFRDVESGRAELGVVPVENSTEGMVAHTLDLLVESPLAICAEITLRVAPLPAGAAAERALARVRRVVAHPQALAQCRQWLAAHLPGRAASRRRATRARPSARRRERGHGGDRRRGGRGDAYGLARPRRAASRTRPATSRASSSSAATTASSRRGDDKTSIVVTVPRRGRRAGPDAAAVRARIAST